MLDQSFSVENFRRICDYENRKGVYLDYLFFPDVFEITRQIRDCRGHIKREKKKQFSDKAYIEENWKRIEVLKKDKEIILLAELEKVSKNIAKKSFRIELTQIQGEIGSKPLYIIDKSPETFFAVKQIQYSINKAFKVKQADRFTIVSQVKSLLSDGFPKYVIRSDIESFYESIPHDRLIKKIDQNNLLSFLTKKLIKQVLRDYKVKSGSDKGIPRGVGISAYLAELYLRDIDNEIKALPNVTYYARYVDDIIIIFTPNYIGETRAYRDEVASIIESGKYKMVMNNAKTQLYDVTGAINYTLEFLGYRINFSKSSIALRLSGKKKAKIKDKIEAAFDFYEKANNEKKERKLLFKRVRFLTTNTRLQNNKKNVLVGIYYSNSLLDNFADLNALDHYLKHRIRSIKPYAPLKVSDITIQKIKDRISKYSFEKGFKEKLFSPFSVTDLADIVCIWK